MSIFGAKSSTPCPDSKRLFSIYPAEVEDAIGALAGVREVAAIGLPHPDLGEAVVAVVLPREQGLADGRPISDALVDKLAPFKQPRRVLFVDELPKNTMAKVQKAELRKCYSSLFNANDLGSIEAPSLS